MAIPHGSSWGKCFPFKIWCLFWIHSPACPAWLLTRGSTWNSGLHASTYPELAWLQARGVLWPMWSFSEGITEVRQSPGDLRAYEILPALQYRWVPRYRGVSDRPVEERPGTVSLGLMLVFWAWEWHCLWQGGDLCSKLRINEWFVSDSVYSIDCLPPRLYSLKYGQVYTAWIFLISYVKFWLLLGLEEVGRHWLISRICLQSSVSLTIGEYWTLLITCRVPFRSPDDLEIWTDHVMWFRLFLILVSPSFDLNVCHCVFRSASSPHCTPTTRASLFPCSFYLPWLSSYSYSVSSPCALPGPARISVIFNIYSLLSKPTLLLWFWVVRRALKIVWDVHISRECPGITRNGSFFTQQALLECHLY